MPFRRLSAALLLVCALVTGLSAVEDGLPLGPGPLRDLLHLGAGPDDRIAGGLFAVDHLDGEASVQPVAGDSLLLSGGTSSPLVWTELHDADGIWATTAADHFVQYWAVAIFAPSSRALQLRLVHDDGAAAWLNGAVVYSRSSSGGSSERLSTAFTLPAGWNQFVFKLHEATGGNLFQVRLTDSAGVEPTDLRWKASLASSGLVRVTAAANAATSEGGGLVAASVVLTQAPTGPVSVPVLSQDPGEGEATVTALDFTPSDWDQPQTIQVVGRDDAIADGDVLYQIALGPVQSTDPAFSGIEPAPLTLINRDNEAQPYVGGYLTNLLQLGAGAVDRIAGGTLADDVFAGQGGEHAIRPRAGDAVLASGGTTTPLVWTTGFDQDGVWDDDSALSHFSDYWAIAIHSPVDRVVQFRFQHDDEIRGWVDGVQVLDRAGWDGNQERSSDPFLLSAGWHQCIFKLHEASGGNRLAVRLTDALGGELPDLSWRYSLHESGPIRVEAPAALATSENGASATVSLRLTGAPEADVTVTLASSDLGEGTVSPGSITFTATDWDQPRVVVLGGVDDALSDGDQPWQLVFGTASSGDPLYDGISLPAIDLINRDNEPAALPPGPIARFLHLGAQFADRVVGLGIADDPFAATGGEAGLTPGLGDTVSIAGATSEPLVWSALARPDGRWATGSFNGFVQYWAIAIHAPSDRTVQLRYQHDDEVRGWCDGSLVLARDGWDGGAEQSTASFALAAGWHQFVFKLHEGSGGNHFQVRFSDSTGADLDDLQWAWELPSASGNLSPTVALLAPVDGAVVPVGAPLTITAQAADADDGVAGVEILVAGVSVGSASANGDGTWSLDWTPPVAGTVAIVARVADHSGATSDSVPVALTAVQPVEEHVGPFRWARFLYQPWLPQAADVARSGDIGQAVLASSSPEGGFIDLHAWQGDNQAGTRSFGGNSLLGAADSPWWIGLSGWSLQTGDDLMQPGTFEFWKQTQQDASLRLAWLQLDGGGLSLLHGDRLLDGPLPANAIVLELPFRNVAGGATAWQLGDHNGSPSQAGVWQVAAGQTLAQAQAVAGNANLLADLSAILSTFAPDNGTWAVDFRSAGGGAWSLAVDIDGDRLADQQIAAGAGGAPSGFTAITGSSGLAISLVAAGGNPTGRVGLTDAMLRYDTPGETPPPPVPPVVFFRDPSGSAVEGAGPVTIPVRLSHVYPEAISVAVTVSAGSAQDGQDFAGGTTSLLFQPGDLERGLLLAINDDGEVEGDETVLLTLGQPSIGMLGVPDQHVHSIIDDDVAPPPTPPLVAFASGASAVAEGAGSAMVRIGLDQPATETVSVSVTVSGGTASAGADYTAPTVQHLIPIGADGIDVLVPISDDAEVEGDETLVLHLTVGAGGLPRLPDTHTLTILDDDQPGELPVIAFATSTSSVAETAGSHLVQLIADRSAATALTIQLQIAGSAGNLDRLIATSVTLPAGATSVELSMLILDDDLSEGDESITIGLAPGTGYQGSASHSVTIVDDEGAADPSASLLASSFSVAETAGLSGEVVVTLSGQSSDTLSLEYTVLAGGSATRDSDYVLADGTLLIPPDTLSVSIPLEPLDDLEIEPDETLLIEIGAFSPGLAPGAILQATVSIVDDDRDRVPAIASFGPAAPSSVVENAGTVSIPVVLDHALDREVRVEWARSGGDASLSSDVLVTGTPEAPGILVFPPGSTEQHIVFEVLDDAAAEPTETLELSLGAPAEVPAVLLGVDPTPLLVAIVDDDGALPAPILDPPAGNPFISQVTVTPLLQLADLTGITVWHSVGTPVTDGSTPLAPADPLPGAPGSSATPTILLDQVGQVVVKARAVRELGDGQVILGAIAEATYTIQAGTPAGGSEPPPPLPALGVLTSPWPLAVQESTVERLVQANLVDAAGNDGVAVAHSILGEALTGLEVPLSGDVTTVRIRYTDSAEASIGAQRRYEVPLIWRVLDLNQAPDPVTVRVGDSIRVSFDDYPSGYTAVRFSHAGFDSGPTTWHTPIVVPFTQAGVIALDAWGIAADSSETKLASLQVSVVADPFAALNRVVARVDDGIADATRQVSLDLQPSTSATLLSFALADPALAGGAPTLTGSELAIRAVEAGSSSVLAGLADRPTAFHTPFRSFTLRGRFIDVLGGTVEPYEARGAVEIVPQIDGLRIQLTAGNTDWNTHLHGDSDGGFDTTSPGEWFTAVDEEQTIGRGYLVVGGEQANQNQGGEPNLVVPFDFQVRILDVQSGSATVFDDTWEEFDVAVITAVMIDDYAGGFSNGYDYEIEAGQLIAPIFAKQTASGERLLCDLDTTYADGAVEYRFQGLDERIIAGLRSYRDALGMGECLGPDDAVTVVDESGSLLFRGFADLQAKAADAVELSPLAEGQVDSVAGRVRIENDPSFSFHPHWKVKGHIGLYLASEDYLPPGTAVALAGPVADFTAVGVCEAEGPGIFDMCWQLHASVVELVALQGDQQGSSRVATYGLEPFTTDEFLAESNWLPDETLNVLRPPSAAPGRIAYADRGCRSSNLSPLAFSAWGEQLLQWTAPDTGGACSLDGVNRQMGPVRLVGLTAVFEGTEQYAEGWPTAALPIGPLAGYLDGERIPFGTVLHQQVVQAEFGIPDEPTRYQRVPVVLDIQSFDPAFDSVPVTITQLSDRGVVLYDAETGGNAFFAAGASSATIAQEDHPTLVPISDGLSAVTDPVRGKRLELWAEFPYDADLVLEVTAEVPGNSLPSGILATDTDADVYRIRSLLHLTRLSNGIGVPDGLSPAVAAIEGRGAVDVGTGNLAFSVPIAQHHTVTRGPDCSLCYNSLDGLRTGLGRGWRSSYDMRLYEADAGLWCLVDGDGTRSPFTAAGGSFAGSRSFDVRVTRRPADTEDGDEAGWLADEAVKLVRHDNRVCFFDASGWLRRIRFLNGEELRVTRDADGFATAVIDHRADGSPGGRTLALTAGDFGSTVNGSDGQLLGLSGLVRGTAGSWTFSYTGPYQLLGEVACHTHADYGSFTHGSTELRHRCQYDAEQRCERVVAVTANAELAGPEGLGDYDLEIVYDAVPDDDVLVHRPLGGSTRLILSRSHDAWTEQHDRVPLAVLGADGSTVVRESGAAAGTRTVRQMDGVRRLVSSEVHGGRTETTFAYDLRGNLVKRSELLDADASSDEAYRIQTWAWTDLTAPLTDGDPLAGTAAINSLGAIRSVDADLTTGHFAGLGFDQPVDPSVEGANLPAAGVLHGVPGEHLHEPSLGSSGSQALVQWQTWYVSGGKRGRAKQAADPCNQVALSFWNNLGFPVRSQDRRGHQTTMAMHNAFGQPRQVSSAEGRRTTYEYADDPTTAFGVPGATGLTTRVLAPTGLATETDYDALQRPLLVQHPKLSGDADITERFAYDPLGGMREHEDKRASNNTTTWAYDALHRPVSQQEPEFAAPLRTSYTATGSGDLVTWQTKTTHATAQLGSTVVDASFRTLRSGTYRSLVVEDDGSAAPTEDGVTLCETLHAYEPGTGWPSASLSPRGALSRVLRDDAGRVVCSEQELDAAGTMARTERSLNVADWEVAVMANPGSPVAADQRTTTQRYDRCSRPTLASNPLGGQVSQDYLPNGLPFSSRPLYQNGEIDAAGNAVAAQDLGAPSQAVYDRDNLVISTIDTKGRHTDHVHDFTNRVFTTSNPDEAGLLFTTKLDGRGHVNERVRTLLKGSGCLTCSGGWETQTSHTGYLPSGVAVSGQVTGLAPRRSVLDAFQWPIGQQIDGMELLSGTQTVGTRTVYDPTFRYAQQRTGLSRLDGAGLPLPSALVQEPVVDPVTLEVQARSDNVDAAIADNTATEPTGAVLARNRDGQAVRTSQVVRLAGDGTPITREFTQTFDLGGRPLTRTSPGDAAAGLPEVTMTNAWSQGSLLLSRQVNTASAETYAYNVLGQRISRTDATGKVIERSSYNEHGELLSSTRGELTTRYFRRSDDRRVEVTELPGGRRVRYELDPDRNRILAIFAPRVECGERGTQPLKQTYDPLERVIARTHPDGTTETISYTVFDAVDTQVDRLGRVITHAYDGSGRLKGRTITDGEEAIGLTYGVDLDLADGGTISQVTATRSLSGTVTEQSTITRYQDRRGRLRRLELPDRPAVLFAYDKADQPLTRSLQEGTDPAQPDCVWTWNDVAPYLESVSHAGGGASASFGYDHLGRRSSSVLSHGVSRTILRDDVGRVTAMTQTLGDAGSQSWTYHYDGTDRLCQVEAPDHRMQLRYDAGGRLRDEERVLLPGVPTELDAYRFRYAYDCNDNRTSMLVQPAAATVQTENFALDGPPPAGVQPAGDGGTWSVAGGALTATIDSQPLTQAGLDLPGLVGDRFAVTVALPATAVAAGTAGELGFEVAATARQRFAVVLANNGPDQARLRVVELASGAVVGTELAGSASFAWTGSARRLVVEVRPCDALHVELRDPADDSLVANLDLTLPYGNAGGVGLTLRTGSAAAPAVPLTGSFDDLSWDNLQNAEEIRQYAYHPELDRLEGVDVFRAGSLAEQWTYESDALGRQVSRQRQVFGATPSSETTTWDYDALDRLRAMDVGAQHFAYNYFGDTWMRSTVAIGGIEQRYLYDGASVIQRQTVGSGGAVTGTTRYLSVNGTCLAEIGDTGHGAGAPVVYGFNGYGDVIARVGIPAASQTATPGTATILTKLSYDAYGNAEQFDRAWDGSNASYLPATLAEGPGYKGQWQDTGTNQVWMRHRYYDPMVGRFTQVDPARAENNWYAYAGGDPVNRWDPSGLYWRFYQGARSGLAYNAEFNVSYEWIDDGTPAEEIPASPSEEVMRGITAQFGQSTGSYLDYFSVYRVGPNLRERPLMRDGIITDSFVLPPEDFAVIRLHRPDGGFGLYVNPSFPTAGPQNSFDFNDVIPAGPAVYGMLRMEHAASRMSNDLGFNLAIHATMKQFAASGLAEWAEIAGWHEWVRDHGGGYLRIVRSALVDAVPIDVLKQIEDVAYKVLRGDASVDDFLRFSPYFVDTTLASFRKVLREFRDANGIGSLRRFMSVDELITHIKKIRTYARPGLRQSARDQIWENALRAGNGKVIDPKTGREILKTDPWDAGHLPGYEFRKHQQSAIDRDIPRQQFIDEYNNPSHFRPELPSSNRGHSLEDTTDLYFGD